MPEPIASSREALARWPLARAVLNTSAYLWRGDFLDDFFRRHAGRSYEQAISFPHLVGRMGDALLRRARSLAAALEHAPATVASRQPYYGKLRRMPLPLSVALPWAAAAFGRCCPHPPRRRRRTAWPVGRSACPTVRNSSASPSGWSAAAGPPSGPPENPAPARREGRRAGNGLGGRRTSPRRRWGIEQVFQRITEAFGLARFIGSNPEATAFQAP